MKRVKVNAYRTHPREDHHWGDMLYPPGCQICSNCGRIVKTLGREEIRAGKTPANPWERV